MARTAPKLGGGSQTLDGVAFEARFNMPLVHEAVRAELSARRQGTASTKTRGQVSGGGAKPWRQKGTGRARAGSSRSPIWTGGGIVFGPHPRSYTFKVNRKEQRAALRSALSLHAQRGSIAVLDAVAFTAPKTSQAADLLDDWGPSAQVHPTLVVLDAQERDAALSFRNLPRVAVLTHENVGVADLIGAASLLVSQAALDALSARAGGEAQTDGGSSSSSSSRAAAQAPAPEAKAAKAKSTKTTKTTKIGKAAAIDEAAATDEPSVAADEPSTAEGES
jgi:large subunit ribosomal protein L4